MKPNVVFILSDQQRWDTCGCYGQPLNVTPNIDQMAHEGVRFSHAFTCQPVCGPARSSLQTGKYPAELGTFRNDIFLPRDQKTIAHHFSEEGYRLGYIGKWHLASDTERGIDHRTVPVPMAYRGGWKDYWLVSDILEFTSHSYDGHMFDTYNRRREFPPNRYRVDVLTDWAVEYLQEQRESEQPFFLFLSYIEPHHQNDHGRYEGPEGSKKRFGNFQPPADLANQDGDWQENYPDYLGAINRIDTGVGRIRETLREMGVAENTVVIYTSDHGSHFRTRNEEYKRSCHEASIRIPLVASGPGFPAATEVNELVSLIDIAPTLLTTAGVPIPAGMHGCPLQESVSQFGDSMMSRSSVNKEHDFYSNEGESWRESIFLQISEAAVARAVRTKRWKYSVYDPEADPWRDKTGKRYVSQYLYNLEEDPHEQHNLAEEPGHAEVRRELAVLLKKHMREAGEDVDSIVINP